MDEKTRAGMLTNISIIFTSIINNYFNAHSSVRCENKDSPSGHMYRPGPMLMKTDGSMATLALCLYCGGSTELIQTEIKQFMPMMPSQYNEQPN